MYDDPSFGRWLQRRRKRLGLTQAELGHSVGLATETIRKIEADARRPSRQAAARLADYLALAPGERSRFLHFALGVAVAHLPLDLPEPRDPQTPVRRALAMNNLPAPLTALIGRERECRQARALFERRGVRLVTLVGAGGIGKTRLAYQLAADLRPEFANGVVYVPLAAIADPALVLSTIAHTLGAHPAETGAWSAHLQAVLRERQLLLVLDNFEHLLPAGPQIAQLLLGAPQLKVLVTSRAPLHLYGEHLFSVPPLPLPAEVLDPPQLAQNAAVALFVERAQAVRQDFTLDATNAAAVAAICCRLDGLPLAIELAAARSGAMAPALLLERLGARLELLTAGPRDAPVRQQTLRATLDWSYNGLQPAEQQLFARLGVFVGGWTLRAAEAVCSDIGAPTSLFDALQALQAQSLVRQVPDISGEPRFAMLETIREYASERLTMSAACAAVRRSHVRFYLELVEHAEPQLKGAQQQLWHRRLEQEYANIRAAFSWALAADDLECAARLSWSLWIFWWVGSHFDEARRWLDTLVARSAALPSAPRARALTIAAAIACGQGAAPQAGELAARSLLLFRTVDDKVAQALAHVALGTVARMADDLAHAAACFEEAVALYDAAGDRWGMVMARSQAGTAWLLADEPERGMRRLHESLELARQIGDTLHIGEVLHKLGDVAVDRREFTEARRLYSASLEISRELSYKSEVAGTLHQLGWIAVLQSDADQAVAQLEACAELVREIGDVNGLCLAAVLHSLAMALLLQNELRRAAAFLHESLRLAQQAGDQQLVAACLEGGAALATRQGDAERAIRCFGAAAALHPIAQCSALDQLINARELHLARAQLDADTCARAWAEGQALPLQHALTAALGDAV